VSLGALLRQERTRRKLSLRELGEKLRSARDPNGPVSPQYLNDIEFERRTPSLGLLEQLAAIYGVELDYLLALGLKAHPDVLEYLRQQPGSGSQVAKVFRRARTPGFTDWEQI
jgi:transcriptional regulator with XRE-family HTH domain